MIYLLFLYIFIIFYFLRGLLFLKEGIRSKLFRAKLYEQELIGTKSAAGFLTNQKYAIVDIKTFRSYSYSQIHKNTSVISMQTSFSISPFVLYFDFFEQAYFSFLNMIFLDGKRKCFAVKNRNIFVQSFFLIVTVNYEQRNLIFLYV